MSKNDVIHGKVIPLRDAILVTDLEYGAQILNGIIIPNDNMTERGIKPRWAKVYRVGPDVTGIEEGNWILQDHARWSIGFYINEGDGNILVRWVDYADTLIVKKDKPQGFTATL